VLEGVGGQRHALAALLSGKRPAAHFAGAWVGLGASLDESRILTLFSNTVHNLCFLRRCRNNSHVGLRTIEQFITYMFICHFLGFIEEFLTCYEIGQLSRRCRIFRPKARDIEQE